MDEERTRTCLRQGEHICGHLLHRYSIAVNQVQVLNFMKYVATPYVRGSVFEEMCKPNIMILISSIENVAKIVMDSVYESCQTMHIPCKRRHKQYISCFRIGLSYEVVETQ